MMAGEPPHMPRSDPSLDLAEAREKSCFSREGRLEHAADQAAILPTPNACVLVGTRSHG
jgi:hypothetical protein